MTQSEALRFYVWTTPNGRKVMIAAEELGLPFEYVPIHIGKGDQLKPEFLAINPNGRIPALVDPNDGKPVTVFESGAILIYLAEKTGRFLAKEEPTRSTTLQWLMFQMAGVGPMIGQFGHFSRRPGDPIEYAVSRYRDESQRLMRVLDKRLSQARYLGGDEYTIADMATFPWVARPQMIGMDPSEIPNVQRWIDEIGARPAVQRAMAHSLEG